MSFETCAAISWVHIVKKKRERQSQLTRRHQLIHVLVLASGGYGKHRDFLTTSAHGMVVRHLSGSRHGIEVVSIVCRVPETDD